MEMNPVDVWRAIKWKHWGIKEDKQQNQSTLTWFVSLQFSCFHSAKLQQRGLSPHQAMKDCAEHETAQQRHCSSFWHEQSNWKITKNNIFFSWLLTGQYLFQWPTNDTVMALALFKLLGNSKSFPCLMPRLRRDPTDNELAGGGGLVTALGLHLPQFVMNFKGGRVRKWEKINHAPYKTRYSVHLWRVGLKIKSDGEEWNQNRLKAEDCLKRGNLKAGGRKSKM